MLWIVLITIVAIAVYAYRNRDHSYPVAKSLPIITAAIENGNDLLMEYFTYRSKTFRKRTVTPLELGDGGVYLRAYDHFRLAERTFKVSRIKDVSEVPHKQKTTRQVR